MTRSRVLSIGLVAVLLAVLLVASTDSTYAAPFPPTVELCGSRSTTTGTTTVTTITPLAGIGLGDDIFVSAINSSSGASGTISVEDDAGNPYITRLSLARDIGGTTGDLTGAHADSLGILAIPTVITITHPTATSRNAFCLRNSSGSPVGYWDGAIQGGSGTSTDTNDIADTTNSPINEAPAKLLLINGISRAPGSTTWTSDDFPLFTQVGSTLLTGTREADAWWQVRNTGNTCDDTPCNADGDFTTTQSHVEYIASYRWGGDLAAEVNQPAGHRSGTSVTVDWSTRSERNIAGFVVYRQPVNGRLVSITERALPARGDAFNGYAYSFTDGDAPTGRTFYWIEALDLDGGTTRYGPVLVQPTNGGGAGPVNDATQLGFEEVVR